MHLDNTQIGLMGSAFGLASMIFYWPGGWLADRVSPRALITLSLVATGLLGFWMATLPSFTALLTIQLLMGMLISLTFWSALIKLVRHLAGHDQQARYFGILESGRNLTAVTVIAAGLAVFRWLEGNAVALQATILIFAGVLIMLGALSWVFVPAVETATTAVAGSQRKIPLSVAINHVIRLPAVWLTMGIILCAYVTTAGSNILTPYATDVYQQSAVTGGVLSVVVQGTGIFASILAGIVADRFGTSRTIIWLLAAVVLTLLVFVFVPGSANLLPLLLVNSVAIGCAFYALRGIYFALLDEGFVPEAITGTATGLISLVAFTPDIFIPAIAGYLLDVYPDDGLGYQIFFGILAAFSIAGVGFTVLFRHVVSQQTAAPRAGTALQL